MRFVDLFAGLGGFHQAAAELGGECVFASEINDSLRFVYNDNFGIEPSGDIRNIPVESIPSHDLLCAGFPCQPFSKAGEQLGWEDAVRGTLFDNIVEILKAKKPEFLILENVAHFVRHDEGNTYRKVREALEAIGYDVDSKQLSPHQFGVPQIRERMYMIGRFGKNSLQGFEWPSPETAGHELSIRDILDIEPSEAVPLSPQVMECLRVWQKFLKAFPKDIELPSFPIWSMEFGATYPYEYDSLWEIELDELVTYQGVFGEPLSGEAYEEIVELVPSYARGKAGAFPKWKQRFIQQNRDFYETHKGWIDPWLSSIRKFPPSLQKFEWNCKGEKRDIWKNVIQFRASGVRVKRPTTSPSLVALNTTQIPIIAWQKRYMTVRECARLQSMDKLEHLPKGRAAHAALGNAVNVRVAQLVLQNLISLRSVGMTPIEEVALGT